MGWFSDAINNLAFGIYGVLHPNEPQPSATPAVFTPPPQSQKYIQSPSYAAPMPQKQADWQYAPTPSGSTPSHVNAPYGISNPSPWEHPFENQYWKDLIYKDGRWVNRAAWEAAEDQRRAAAEKAEQQRRANAEKLVASFSRPSISTPTKPSSFSNQSFLDKLVGLTASPAYAAGQAGSGIAPISGNATELSAMPSWLDSVRADFRSLFGKQSSWQERLGGLLGLTATGLPFIPEMNISEKLRYIGRNSSKVATNSSFVSQDARRNLKLDNEDTSKDNKFNNIIGNDYNNLLDRYKESTLQPTGDEEPDYSLDDDFYAGINKEVIDNIMSGVYGSDMEAQEDYYRRAEEAAKQKLLAKYNWQQAELENYIPQYESEAQEGISAVQKGLKELRESGQKYKDESTIKYGELERGLTTDEMQKSAQLRNIFSNLGTAESSSFQENLMNLAKDYSGQRSDVRREMIGYHGDINSALLKAEEDANAEIKKIQDDLTDKKNYIAKAKNLSEEEKLAAIEELGLEMEGKIMQVYEGYNNAKLSLLTQQMQQANILQQLKYQGDIDYNNIKAQAQLIGYNNMQSMPSGLESKIRQFYYGGYSASPSYLENLKTQYPGYEDLIEGVWKGGISEEDFNKMIGGNIYK